MYENSLSLLAEIFHTEIGDSIHANGYGQKNQQDGIVPFAFGYVFTMNARLVHLEVIMVQTIFATESSRSKCFQILPRNPLKKKSITSILRLNEP
jgi:hypothetical protein